jgi:hypothetical protein
VVMNPSIGKLVAGVGRRLVRARDQAVGPRP